MDIQQFLPIISKALGRDFSVEVNLFYRSRAAVGASMNAQGQEFFIKHWPKIVDFMEMPEGREAIVNFMNSWAKNMVPVTLAKEPEPAHPTFTGE